MSNETALSVAVPNSLHTQGNMDTAFTYPARIVASHSTTPTSTQQTQSGTYESENNKLSILTGFQNMNPHDIGKAISEAKLTERYDVVSGDCISIANAIKDVFGGTVIAITDRPGCKTIEHAAVRKGDRVFDGRGIIEEEQLCKEFTPITRIHPETTRKHVWEPAPPQLDRHKGRTYNNIQRDLKDTLNRE